MKIIEYLVPINSVCNQKCVFCSAEYRMSFNPKIPLKTILKQILEKDNYIQISGGEPLLDPRLERILAFIRKIKPKAFIELQTNGVFLKSKLDTLEKYNIDLYNVNYPAHIEDINDKIVGIKNTFKAREDAMREVIKKGLNLRINIVVNKLNYKILPEMMDYIKNNFIGFERIQLSFVKVMGGADKNGKDVVPSYQEVSKFIIYALEKVKNYGFKLDVDHIPLCFLGDYYKFHTDYKKIISGQKGIYMKEKIYIKKCDDCNLKKFCSGYRKDYLTLYSE